MAEAKAQEKGQSILEYFIMLTAITAAIILAAGSLGQKVRTGRNAAAVSIGNSFALNPSVTLAPRTNPGNRTDPDDPISNAQVIIPTSVYLTPAEIRILSDAGILIGGRSDYDPPNGQIQIVGTLTAAQLAAVQQVQQAINARLRRG